MLFSKITQAIALAAAVGLTSAQPIGHLHHKHAKRNVVVVTETKIVTVGAGDDAATATIDYVHAASSAVEISSASTTVGAQVVPTTTSKVKSSSSASSSTSAASSTSSSDSDSSFSAGTKGITYSPYTASGACKTADEVASDLAYLTDYSVIRLYGVDCNQVENVFAAKASGQKLLLGIYFVDAIDDAVSQISDAVSKYGSWDDVHSISVGNELVNSGEASVSQVGEYIATARSAFSNAGYSGDIVSADTHVAIINNPGLCKYSDYVAINAHAYFDGYIYPSGAGDWLLLQIERVWSACGGDKNVFVTETGWPSQGNSYGVAVPSKSNQKTAIESIQDKCGSSAVAFTAFNDYWKADGSYGVEKYWGLYSD
ncbi:unnamed protein product [Kuraishia capsulata CBS 1993]|uniref:Glycoside hydrolase family 17 protein n=1 Tax=Kuraishia capsulata CBS 1993 TaxID=1382522 RepID=W6MTQ1_9ASCO|nr:uncharacterized protein KUCA_T00004581001 [Kuraishia capsulata CBS 1993]CDK28597.1 unnamed protein product [Kuraishia capsulata CBS 1993]